MDNSSNVFQSTGKTAESSTKTVLPLEILPTSSSNIHLRTHDVLHLIADTLDSLGLHETVTKLKQETNLTGILGTEGIPALTEVTPTVPPPQIISVPLIQEFRNAVLEGNWLKIYTLFDKIPFVLSKPWDYYFILFAIFRQHYLELLEHQSFTQALLVLRKFIVPFQVYCADTLGHDKTLTGCSSNHRHGVPDESLPVFSSSYSFAPLESSQPHQIGIRPKDLVYIGYTKKVNSENNSEPPVRSASTTLLPTASLDNTENIGTDIFFQNSFTFPLESYNTTDQILSLLSSANSLTSDIPVIRTTTLSPYTTPLILSFTELFATCSHVSEHNKLSSAPVYPTLFIPPLNSTPSSDGTLLLTIPDNRERQYLDTLLSSSSTDNPYMIMTQLFSSTSISRLSTLLLPNNVDDLCKISSWKSGIHGKSRLDLLYCIERRLHPSILPRLRLPHLLGQAIMHQYESCHGKPYYSLQPSIVSLTRDHTCDRMTKDSHYIDSIPSRCGGKLSGHNDEVWGSVWTLDGQLLLSFSKDGEILVWDGTAMIHSIIKSSSSKQTNTFLPLYRWKPMEDYDNSIHGNRSTGDTHTSDTNSNVATGTMENLPKPLNTFASRSSITSVQIFPTLQPQSYLVAVVGTRASYALVYFIKYSPTVTECTLYRVYDIRNDGGIIDCAWLKPFGNGQYRLAVAGAYGGIWLWNIPDPYLNSTITVYTKPLLPCTDPDKFWLTPREVYGISSAATPSSLMSSSSNPNTDILVVLGGGSQLIIINYTYTIDNVSSHPVASSPTGTNINSTNMQSSSSMVLPIVSQDISHLGYRPTTCTLLPDNRHVLCTFHRKNSDYKRITNEQLQQYYQQKEPVPTNTSSSLFSTVSDSNRGFPFSSSRILNRLFGSRNYDDEEGRKTNSSSSSSTGVSSPSLRDKLSSPVHVHATMNSTFRDNLIRHTTTMDPDVLSLTMIPKKEEDGSIKERIVVWDIVTGTIVQYYEGYLNERTVLLPTVHRILQTNTNYSKADTQNFEGLIASGSENGSLYVWPLSLSPSSSSVSRRTNYNYYYELQHEHKGNINHINWYPGTLINSSVFITASDDYTLRIWYA